MTQEELEKKYLSIPQEIKNTSRWVCYKIEKRDGKETKVPVNAINGGYARSNDENTWTTFRVAVIGCIKYNCAGIGFMLGSGYFGVDLDNHEESAEFDDLVSEFVVALNSYSERSHSGKGVHIICKGSLPVGARRKGCVEMYDSGRFFTMTGNVINPVQIFDRTEEIKPLWKKYLNANNATNYQRVENTGDFVFGENMYAANVTVANTMTDSELIDKIKNSRYKDEFIDLYYGIVGEDDDHSAKDYNLCKILAFWTGNNPVQMDRIFRKSNLMREKWEQPRNPTNRGGISLSGGTYGSQVIELAIKRTMDVYTPPKKQISVIKENVTPMPVTEIVEFDEKNDPIINIKDIFKSYSLDDTGNAERFYDYFGEYFKFNKSDKMFMFWNGKTWTRDGKDIIRKYANKMIEVLKQEANRTEQKIADEEDEEQLKVLNAILKAQYSNIQRVSNKAGKDAMLSELSSLHDIPVINDELDTQENYLNTDSGVVNLYDGTIMPFDKKYLLSKNTNCRVCFEEPTTWLKFLNDIFKRDNPQETKELIDTIQMALGESLTGRTNKEHLYIMYGTGSNGKSTFIQVVNDVFGDYGTVMNSDMLMQSQTASSQSNEFALSALLGARMVSTSETAEGKKLDEVQIKKMLSGEQITAQIKYGNQFKFRPKFSPWMSTNNRPIIRATDFGTWRRIIYIPFLNTFTDDKKDVDMPKKLAREMDKILGWMIKGAVKIHTEFKDILPKPRCLEIALADYKKELDVICAFLADRCIISQDGEVGATKLYQTYKEWCKDGNEYCYSERKFKEALPNKGYKLKKNPNSGWVYQGLVIADNHEGFFFGE